MTKKDKKGNDIYEGDILGVEDPEDDSRAVVEFHDSGFAVRPVGGMIYAREWSNWIVIGNIYDNHELGVS